MVKAFFSKNGQIKVTVPRAIAEAMQLRHKERIFFVFNGHNWELRKEESNWPYVKVVFSKNNQVKITIPRAIAEAMELEHKDKVVFVFNGKNWEIKKEGKRDVR